jgi:Ca2+-transporting ATPase
LAVAGLVLGGTTLGVIWWAHDKHGTVLARTMGMTTFAIGNVFLSFTVKDDLKSFFSVETFADRRLLKATGMSALAIVLATSLGILQRILGTVTLSGKQWIVCILAGFSIVIASELQKFLRRRRADAATAGDVPATETAGQIAVGSTTP